MRKIIACLVFLMIILAAFHALAADPTKGVLRVSGDNTWDAYVNGEQVGTGADWQQVGVYEFDLQNGSAIIAVHVHDAEPGAAGVGGALIDIVLNDDTYIASGVDEGWKASADDSYLTDMDWIESNFDDSGWEPPMVYDAFGGGVWGFGAGAMQQFLKEPDCTAFWVWAGPNDGAD